MYSLESQPGRVIVDSEDLITEKEALEICQQVKEELTEPEVNDLIVDVRGTDLEASCFDVFVNYLSKMPVKRIALVLDNLLSKLKFSFWSRKYRPQINIGQFESQQQAKDWLD